MIEDITASTGLEAEENPFAGGVLPYLMDQFLHRLRCITDLRSELGTPASRQSRSHGDCRFMDIHTDIQVVLATLMIDLLFAEITYIPVLNCDSLFQACLLNAALPQGWFLILMVTHERLRLAGLNIMSNPLHAF